MHFEKLEKTPISGEYSAIHFRKSTQNSVWIKFKPDDSLDWLGSFEKGEFKLENEKFLELHTKPQISILTEGAFYVIDYMSRELIFHPDDNFYIDFQFDSEERKIFLATFFGIYIFKDNELIKKIRPEFIDGIRFNGLKNGIILGDICEPGLEWTSFEIDTETLILKWGKYEF